MGWRRHRHFGLVVCGVTALLSRGVNLGELEPLPPSMSVVYVFIIETGFTERVLY
jgi:hypothetical protein